MVCLSDHERCDELPNAGIISATSFTIRHPALDCNFTCRPRQTLQTQDPDALRWPQFRPTLGQCAVCSRALMVYEHGRAEGARSARADASL